MNEYKYSGLPLSPTMAAELLLPFLLQLSKPIRRAEISRYVEQKHVELGGLPVTDVEQRVKRALSRLVEDGKISSPAIGYYKAQLTDSEGETKLDLQSDLVIEPAQLLDEQIAPERIIGDGQESVYVYFSESDRKLASYENRRFWACKVGFTAGNVSSRILAQGINTSMANLPVLGLVIKAEDGHRLERALHIALDFAGSRIEEAIGAEWFWTSPTVIVAWFEKFQDSNALLRTSMKPTDKI